MPWTRVRTTLAPSSVCGERQLGGRFGVPWNIVRSAYGETKRDELDAWTLGGLTLEFSGR